MLYECVEKCPDGLWLSGEHPRAFWRVAWHAAHFTHSYLVQNEEAFNNSVDAWPSAIRATLNLGEDRRAIDVEPYDLPEGTKPLSQQQLMEYISYIRGLVDSIVEDLDLETDDSGFSWYPTISKLSHQLLNLRHIQGHVGLGQISELLMQRGIDTSWIAKGESH